MAAIDLVDPTKSYGTLKAVDGVSLSVSEGEFVGILGPHGAGKTTTLEIAEGFRQPDAGSATILAERSWPRNPALLPRMGVQLQASSFFERLTAREQIHTFASLYGVAASVADDWLEQVGLEEKAGTRTEDLSGGQMQRLSIACALLLLVSVVLASGVTSVRTLLRVLENCVIGAACDDAPMQSPNLDEFYVRLSARHRSDVQLTLSAPQRPWNDVIVDYLVDVTGAGVQAQTMVTSLQGDGLSEFLGDLAEHFRGWPGVRSWRSLEGSVQDRSDMAQPRSRKPSPLSPTNRISHPVGRLRRGRCRSWR